MWKIGVSEADITPPKGVELWGYTGRITFEAEGIHDPLKVKAAVFSNGETTAIVVSADLGAIPRKVVENVRRRIFEKYGVPAENIITAATHTHSGPAVVPLRRAGEKVDEKYVYLVERKIITVIEEALSSLSEGEVFFAKGFAEKLAFDRRRKGSPVDSEVPLIALFKKNALQGLIVNYACHPVCLGEENLLVSADYPCYLYDTLSRVYGKQLTTVFLTGACGNIDPVWRGRGYKYAERMGRALAGEVIRALETSREALLEEIKCVKTVVKLETEELPSLNELLSEKARLEEELRKLRKEIPVIADVREAVEIHSREAFLSWTMEAIELVKRGEVKSEYELEIQVLEIGDVFIVGLSGEIFSELGLAIKELCRKRALVVGYANGDIGYIPTDKAIDEGGYEIENAFKYYKEYPYPPKKGWEKIILNAVKRLLADLK